MTTVSLLLEAWQKRVDGRAYVADHREIDRCSPSDDFRPEIDLGDPDPRTARIELPIGESGPEHEQDVAICHRVVAGRKADQTGHADVVRIVPLDVLLALQRVNDRSLETLGESYDLHMSSLTARAAQHRHAALSVQQCGPSIQRFICRRHGGSRWQKIRRVRISSRSGWLQRDVAGDDDHRNAAIGDSLTDRELQRALHLIGTGHKLAIVTALLEQLLRMRLLEISGADLARWDLRGDGEDRHTGAMTIKQAVDEMQVSRPATTGTDRKLSRQM